MNSRLIPSILFVAAILIVGISHSQMTRISQENELVDRVNLEKVPPEIRVISAVSGNFRSILANIIWMRSVNEYQAHRYYGMAQMATWLAYLQPRNQEAVAYQSWNMAYNLTTRLQDPAERWYWIERSISLLRDRAIPMNPGESGLYAELSWLYQHKIGQDLDMENRFYKNSMARQMLRLLGDQPDIEKIRSAPYDLSLISFRIAPRNPYIIEEQIIDKYGSLVELIKRYREKKSTTKTEITRLFTAKHAEQLLHYLELNDTDELTDEAIAFPLDQALRAKLDFGKLRSQILQNGRLQSNIVNSFKTVHSEDLQTLLQYLTLSLRHQLIKKEYNLEIDFMIELNKRYGNFDWRLPETHALYWAALGMKNDPDSQDNRCFEMVLTNLKSCFEKGSLLFYRDPITNIEEITWSSNTALADSVNQTYLAMIANPKLVDAELDLIRNAYLNFLTDATVKLTLFESRERGMHYFKLLKSRTGNQIQQSLDEFVQAAFNSKKGKRSAVDTSSNVLKLLVQAHLHTGLQDPKKGLRLYHSAKEIYDAFDKKTAMTRDRVGLPRWQTLENQARAMALRQFPFLRKVNTQNSNSTSPKEL